MNNEFLKRIERYVNHQMNAVETASFESDLQCDPDLARDYNMHMELLQSLRDKEVIELRKKLKTIIGKSNSPGIEESGGAYFVKWFWLAAAIVIFMGISSVLSDYFLNNPNPVLYFERWLDNNWQEREAYQLPVMYLELLSEKKHEEDFKVLYPRDSTVFINHRYVAFKWINTLGSSIYLEIFDRHGQMVYSSPNPAHSPEILQLDLKDGAYIYRFKTRNEILCHGMFYIH